MKIKAIYHLWAMTFLIVGSVVWSTLMLKPESVEKNPGEILAEELNESQNRHIETQLELEQKKDEVEQWWLETYGESIEESATKND